MKIRTLSDVKREMANRRPFYIVNHRKEEYIGQVRIANVIQTNGIYSIVYNEPSNCVSFANDAKGVWLEYGKASQWDIDELTGHCKYYWKDQTEECFVMEIVFFGDELK